MFVFSGSPIIETWSHLTFSWRPRVGSSWWLSFRSLRTNIVQWKIQRILTSDSKIKFQIRAKYGAFIIHKKQQTKEVMYPLHWCLCLCWHWHMLLIFKCQKWFLPPSNLLECTLLICPNCVSMTGSGCHLAAQRCWLDGRGGGQTPEGESGAWLVLGAGVQSLRQWCYVVT